MKLLLTVIIIAVGLWILAASRRWRSEHASMSHYPAPGEGTDHDVERFVQMRRKMTAIKLYREIHDVDLKTAREAVESMAKRMGKA